MTDNLTIGFLGGGNMAEAILGGLLAQGHPAQAIRIGEPRGDRCAELSKKYGVVANADNLALVEHSDILILAVKPQVMNEVLLPLAESVRARRPLLVSIAAGITIRNLADWTASDLAIVRCMPNTPALVGAGVSGLTASRAVTAADREQVTQVMQSVGPVHWVRDEAQLDALMAISGCGPAYFFTFVEHLAAAGTKLGLPSDMAEQLARQTAWGAMKLMHETDTAPDELRRRVTSPGGTTQAALAQFEADGLSTLFENATQAAVTRAKELAVSN